MKKSITVILIVMIVVTLGFIIAGKNPFEKPAQTQAAQTQAAPPQRPQGKSIHEQYNEKNSASLQRAKDLVAAGADLDNVYENGHTLLIDAVYNNDFETVKFLTEHGASAVVEGKYGNAMEYAVNNSRLQMIKYFIERGVDVNVSLRKSTALCKSIHRANMPIIKYLISQGAELEIKCLNDTTALSLAGQYKKLDAMKYLIEKGANVNAKVSNGMTVLSVTALGGFLEGVKILLDNGAQINQEAKGRATALDWVAANMGEDKNKQEIAKYLKSRGGKINLPNNQKAFDKYIF